MLVVTNERNLGPSSFQLLTSSLKLMAIRWASNPGRGDNLHHQYHQFAVEYNYHPEDVEDEEDEDSAPVVWGIRIQPTFALVRVVRGD